MAKAILQMTLAELKILAQDATASADQRIKALKLIQELTQSFTVALGVTAELK